MQNNIKTTHVIAMPVFVACSPATPSFHADGDHWYLSQGIDHINGNQVIQNSLPNGLNPEEQKEP
jgi:hypothetical protein